MALTPLGFASDKVRPEAYGFTHPMWQCAQLMSR
jgi:hypothetical protein